MDPHWWLSELFWAGLAVLAACMSCATTIRTIIVVRRYNRAIEALMWCVGESVARHHVPTLPAWMHSMGDVKLNVVVRKFPWREDDE